MSPGIHVCAYSVWVVGVSMVHIYINVCSDLCSYIECVYAWFSFVIVLKLIHTCLRQHYTQCVYANIFAFVRNCTPF